MTSLNKNTPTVAEADISDIQIVDYLKKNPEFFRHHPDILGDMTLPHASGKAVSLVERQVAILRERSIQTRHKLGELLDIASDNDALFNKTQALVLALLKATTIDELIATTRTQFEQQFDVESASILLLCDNSKDAAVNIDSSALRSREDATQHINNLLDHQQTLCSALREGEAGFLFAEPEKIGSAAVTARDIPAEGNDTRYTLLLSVAHQNSDHYNQNTGTLFLDYIADILQLLIQRIIAL